MAEPVEPPPIHPLTPSLVAAVVVRPRLWAPALGAAVRHRPERWWRPGSLRSVEPWLRFRLETAYGAERTQPTTEDLLTWLRWLRVWARLRAR